MIFAYQDRYATISDEDIARVQLASFIESWSSEVIELDEYFAGSSHEMIEGLRDLFPGLKCG